MKTVDQMQGRWGEVFSLYGMPPINPKRHYPGECPICGGKGKLRIDDKSGSGSWICTCGAGYGMDLLIQATGKDFRTLAAEIDKEFNLDFDKENYAQVKKDTSRRDKAIRLFKEGSPLKGTQAEEYLHSRGIFELPRGGVKYGVAQGKECMIALASTEFSEPRQMHCTFLVEGKKIEGTARKMFSLASKDLQDQDTNEPIAIKLDEATDVLGVAEGIETALSAKQLYRVPTWSTMNATFLKRFRAPTGVKTLYVFADNDSSLTGLHAAMECGRGNLLCKNDVHKVVIRWPSKVNDFNDVIIEGDDVLEWTGER